MSKITSAEMHQNDNSGIEFGSAIVGAVQRARAGMATLANSRKADEYAPGAIHALRKLCEGERRSGQIHRQEVEEWQEVFFAWFNRVKRWFPAGLADKFRANAEDDFRTILESATSTPEFLWRQDVPRRHIQVSFPSEAALKAARAAAEAQYPVPLGSPLHKYLESCVARLVGDDNPPAPQQTLQKGPAGLVARFTHAAQEISLIIDDFECFDTPEEVEQDIVVTAYDVEDAVKRCLAANSPGVLDTVRFDSESSMFVVRVPDPSGLSAVIVALARMASDHDQFARYLHREQEPDQRDQS